MVGDRARYLLATDDVLLSQCRVDRYRASGPGGQKRNKTDSAVRLRHTPTGLVAQGEESRSQHENRERALRRLRERLAFELREPVQLEQYRAPVELARLVARGAARPGARTRRQHEYLAAIAALLDLFVAAECSVSETARQLGISTGALSRFLLGDDHTARKVNELRSARGMRALR